MTLEKAIASTVAYHDIFSYPLTASQIRSFLAEFKTSQKALNLVLKRLISQRKIETSEGYFYLKNKSKLVFLRRKRAKHSEKKIKLANFYASVLRLVPTISCVCLTGALAMDNSDKNDDIDLLIMTRKHTLWTSRFFANLLLWPARRRPNSTKNANKACLNIFLDEADLKIVEQNIYTAHEICQMKLLWGTQSYLKFLKINSWHKEYLPNWNPENQSDNQKRRITMFMPNFLEEFFKKIQLFYMGSKVTIEKVGDTQVFFHPKKTQEDILAEYQRRIKKPS